MFKELKVDKDFRVLTVLKEFYKGHKVLKELKVVKVFKVELEP